MSLWHRKNIRRMGALILVSWLTLIGPVAAVAQEFVQEEDVARARSSAALRAGSGDSRLFVQGSIFPISSTVIQVDQPPVSTGVKIIVVVLVLSLVVMVLDPNL